MPVHRFLRLSLATSALAHLASCSTATIGSGANPTGGRAGQGGATSAGGSTGQGGGPAGMATGGTSAGTGGSTVDAGPSSSDTSSPACLELTDQADTVTLSNCIVRITISKRTGLADYAWNQTLRLRGAFASVRLATDLRVQDAALHEIAIAQATPLQDALGVGKRITAIHTSPGRPTIRQSYYVYEKTPFLFVDEDVTDAQPVSSNRISPLAIDATGAVELGTMADGRILIVPFHNDEFTRYDARSLSSTGESYEVTALYDNQTRAGLVLGSATHDVWKSAVAYTGANGRILTLDAYGGASSAATQDTQPHGAVSGTTIRSPRMFVGWFADWRDGLEVFSRANAALAPNAHPWKGGVIFGFNTWSAYACNVTEPIYEGASNFVARFLMPNTFNGTTSVFLNWDACGAASAASAAHVKSNGQRAGMYATPFTSWGDGSDPAILKDDKGVNLPKIDGGYPLDPTHPSVKNFVVSNIANHKAMGYEYIKMDFMTHGVREGVHYDKTITTGVQAYNYGLQYIAGAIGDTMFADLSIAPIFPGGQYVHARRVSCDAFGGIFNSEYLMNNAGYGWWLNGGVYQYNDPDHIVLATSAADGNQLHTIEEARTRVTASAIGGAVFLDSDKLDSDPEAQSRASMLLTNPDINAVARRGKTFRPVEGNTGTSAPSVFVSNDGTKFYLAAFNWNNSAATTLVVDLARAGLEAGTTYAVRDLWTGVKSTARGTLGITLPKTASTIYELVPGT